MAKFVLVINEATTEQYLRVVEHVTKSGGGVRMRPEAVNGPNDPSRVTTASMNEWIVNNKTLGYQNIRLEWQDAGAKHAAEIVRIFEPQAQAQAG